MQKKVAIRYLNMHPTESTIPIHDLHSSAISASGIQLQTPPSSTECTVSKKRLMEFFDNSTASNIANLSTLDEAFEVYISSSHVPGTDPIAYWSNSLSMLKIVALEILSVPASSAPVERVFSRAGRIISPLRSRLSPHHLELLTIIACNSD